MIAGPGKARNYIGLLNEKSLHADLKSWYAESGDLFEVPVDGFIIDIVRDGVLIEIQTCNFAAAKLKLTSLIARHQVNLLYPISQEKWLLKLAEDGRNYVNRRKSPKRGTIFNVFEELVSIPELLVHPNFSLNVVFIHEEEVRRYDENRSWRRRGWIIHERRLLRIVEQRLLETPADLSALVPDSLVDPFTTSDLAKAINKPRRLAQKMVYCLRRTGSIKSVGKRGNTILYTRVIC